MGIPLSSPAPLAFSVQMYYTHNMDIENVSTGMPQDKVQQEAALKVQAMAIRNAEEQSAALNKLLESAEVVTDTEVGNNVDLLG
jgi:hypothetical protein